MLWLRSVVGSNNWTESLKLQRNKEEKELIRPSSKIVTVAKTWLKNHPSCLKGMPVSKQNQIRQVYSNTHNHPSMCTHVKIIVPCMTYFVVYHRPCIVEKCREFPFNQENWIISMILPEDLPGGTLSGDPGWKNFVWWFFWATMTTNFGVQFSSRNLQACITQINSDLYL